MMVLYLSHTKLKGEVNMTNKRNFIRKSAIQIAELDNGLGVVEQALDELVILVRKVTEAEHSVLEKLDGTKSMNYHETLDKLSILLSDAYTYKNDLLDALDEINDDVLDT